MCTLVVLPAAPELVSPKVIPPETTALAAKITLTSLPPKTSLPEYVHAGIFTTRLDVLTAVCRLEKLPAVTLIVPDVLGAVGHEYAKGTVLAPPAVRSYGSLDAAAVCC